MSEPKKVLMSADEFGEFVRKQGLFMRSMVDSKSDSITPMLVVDSVNEQFKRQMVLCSLMVPFNEDQEKRGALSNLGAKFYSDGRIPIAVCLITEAWVAPEGRASGIEPRDHPERREAVVLAAHSFDRKHSAVVSLPVRRGKDNLIEIDGEPTMSAEARFPLLDFFFKGFARAALAGL